MKRMILVCCAVAGLGLASAALAENAPAPAAAPAPSLCAILSPASATVSPAELPNFIPPPVSRTTHCGTCSAINCRNANFGNACVISNHVGFCRSQSGDSCPTDPTNLQCDCVYNPL